jgi:hypothetical protein
MAKILIFLTDVGIQIIDDKPTNNTVEEICGVYLALEKQGHEPYILVNDDISSKKYRTVHRDVDVDQFDELLMNREEPNFFGGEINKYHIFTINSLCKFKGRISYFFCDPEMAKGEYIKKFYEKLYVLTANLTYMGSPPMTMEDKQKHFPKSMLEDNIYKTKKENLFVRSAYPIRNHPIHARFHEVEFIDSWREHLFNVREPYYNFFEPSFSELKKSVCYIGSNKRSRHRRLNELNLFNSKAEEDGLINFYGKIAKFRDNSNVRVSLENVSKIYEDHIASLVIGNAMQNNTGINHRFLQGLTVSKAMLIDQTVDDKKTFMKSDYLNHVLYFKDREEFIDKLTFIRDHDNFNKVVSLLQEEKEWIVKETVEDFIKRVSE